MKPHNIWNTCIEDPTTDGISCRHCDTISYSHEDLIKHHKSQHKDKAPSIYKCHTCDFYSKINKNVQEHSLKEHGKKYFAYQCKKCNKQIKTFLSYRTHMKTKCKSAGFTNKKARVICTKLKNWRRFLPFKDDCIPKFGSKF